MYIFCSPFNSLSQNMPLSKLGSKGYSLSNVTSGLMSTNDFVLLSESAKVIMEGTLLDYLLSGLQGYIMTSIFVAFYCQKHNINNMLKIPDGIQVNFSKVTLHLKN